jgi:hypothetical protein
MVFMMHVSMTRLPRERVSDGDDNHSVEKEYMCGESYSHNQDI